MSNWAAAGGEHRVDVPAAACGAGQGKAAAPERWLNWFVSIVALIERVGNTLGTLAFTWATVVLLGGYPTVLIARDFWCATVMVFLEAVRMFSRDDNKLDYQLFFRTRGAFRFLGWNKLILIVCFGDVLVCAMIWNGRWVFSLPFLLLAILAIVWFLSPGAARLLVCDSLCHAISLWSPMVAIMSLGPCVPYSYVGDDYNLDPFPGFIPRNSIVKWTIYLVLFMLVLLLTISKLRFPAVVRLVDCALGRKLVSWRGVIINWCMFAAIVMLASTFHGVFLYLIITFQVYALVIVSFGKLQIPTALLRFVLALSRLIPQQYHAYGEHVDEKSQGNTNNFVKSLNIFYVMVLGQGILYIVACILEVFSFILRVSLVRRAGFRGPLGMEYVNLYYAYAFEKCMGGALLAPKKISLLTFATDSLKSDSSKMQLYGLHMLHNFMKTEPLKTKAITKLTSSPKTMTSLFNMLGWTSEGDKDIRSFAAKVTADVAFSLRVVPVSGAMQLIASLLENVPQRKIMDPDLDIDSPDAPVQKVTEDKMISPMLKWLKQTAMYCMIPREELSNMDEQNYCIIRWWKQIAKCWSVPREDVSTDHDFLPVLGMLILDKLASCDIQNCIEISRTTGLISKIIEFTGSRINMKITNQTHQTLLKGSALKMLRRLAGTEGNFGVNLRQKISEHPFLLSNLAEILDDARSSKELRELTAELIRNLSMDGNMKEEIGHIRVIISRLMHAFLSQGATSSADSVQLLPVISGEALAVLATESANNCLCMLAEPGYAFIKELTAMIHGDRYRYIASSLLRNMCKHARAEFGNSDLKEVSYILREVLEGIMDAEGAELEVLVGLSSQICNAIPGDFGQELEHDQLKERFIKRLVNALNSNMTPTAHCPGIRRVIVEHAICMMECNPGHATCFKKYWMMEALLRVERTPSRAENYRFFLGDAGLMEHSAPLSELVSRAKELMSREYL